jgi:hypothetical protein
MAKSVIKNNTIEQSLDKGFPMTFAQKVLAINGGLKKCVPGQVVTVTPSHLLTHDNTSAIIGKIKEELDEHGVCMLLLPVQKKMQWVTRPYAILLKNLM